MARILVVDDEPDIASSIKVGLERRGYQVDSFTSSVEALGRFNLGSYQLVIVDVRMPVMDGFQFAREIRKLDPAVKVRFLTAFDVSRGEFEKALPGHDYGSLIQKPLMIEQLALVIKNSLLPASVPGAAQL